MGQSNKTTLPRKLESSYRLMIEYTNGIEKVYYFDTWQEAYNFVYYEGDHVVDWDINGE